MSSNIDEFQAHDSDNEPNIIRDSSNDESSGLDVDTTVDNVAPQEESRADDVKEVELEATTENGAPSLATTLDARLDLFFKTVRDLGNLSAIIPRIAEHRATYPSSQSSTIASVNQDNTQLYKLIDASLAVDRLDTLKILFNWRDCRGGKGDYDGFIVAINYLLDVDPYLVLNNLQYIPEYGSYLDLVKLWNATVSNRSYASTIMMIITTRLIEDKRLLESGDADQQISLVAKWIPSENGHWDFMAVPSVKPGDAPASKKIPKPRFCIELCKSLFGVLHPKSSHLKQLRKEYLVPLRTHLRIVEQNIASKTYASINYQAVPSLAMKKYRAAFLRHDGVRFAEYLHRVQSGKAKINAGQVYPHDLVRHYLNQRGDVDQDIVIEEQWKVIAEKVHSLGVFDNSLVVCDVSGSMHGTPIEVAIALGILGMNNRRLVTFSAEPQLHTVVGDSLRDQVASVRGMNWGMNTDFSKVCDLILSMDDTSITKIFIFSDMQFDIAIRNKKATHFESLKLQFAARGREMPTIIFWNLRCDTKDFPVRSNENGVVLLSGYSPSLLTALLDGEEITPLSIMLKTIRGPRYDKITILS